MQDRDIKYTIEDGKIPFRFPLSCTSYIILDVCVLHIVAFNWHSTRILSYIVQIILLCVFFIQYLYIYIQYYNCSVSSNKTPIKRVAMSIFLYSYIGIAILFGVVREACNIGWSAANVCPCMYIRIRTRIRMKWEISNGYGLWTIRFEALLLH